MAKSGFICKDGSSSFYMTHESMGSFLNPPGDAEHHFSIREERGGSIVGMYSLRGVINESWIPNSVKSHARAMINSYKKELVPTPEWIASVYNYFRNCYAHENLDRSASNCIVDKTNSLPAERHLAVLHIKEWFPDYPIRYEFLNGAPFGSWAKS